jgi:hypothetical protein
VAQNTRALGNQYRKRKALCSAVTTPTVTDFDIDTKEGESGEASSVSQKIQCSDGHHFPISQLELPTDRARHGTCFGVISEAA